MFYKQHKEFLFNSNQWDGRPPLLLTGAGVASHGPGHGVAILDGLLRLVAPQLALAVALVEVKVRAAVGLGAAHLAVGGGGDTFKGAEKAVVPLV